MLRRLKPSPAMAVALLALFVQAVLNGLGTDCAYVAQYTTNR